MGSGGSIFHIDWYEDYFEVTFTAAQRGATITAAAMRSAVLEAIAKVPEAKFANVQSFRLAVMSKSRK